MKFYAQFCNEEGKQVSLGNDGACVMRCPSLLNAIDYAKDVASLSLLRNEITSIKIFNFTFDDNNGSPLYTVKL